MKYPETFRLHADVDAEEGANLTEYALLVSLIAVVCFIGIQILGQEVSAKISVIASGIGNE